MRLCYILLVGVKIVVQSLSGLIEDAKVALNSGKFSEALSIYDKAIAENNANHLAYFLRGNLNEVLRRYLHSINDYSRALELKSDFHKARLNRGLLFVKQGELEKAQIDFKFITKSSHSEFIEETIEHVKRVDQIKIQLEDMNTLLLQKNIQKALEISNEIIIHVPFDINVRKTRADLFEKTKDVEMQISELSVISQLNPNDLTLSLKLSTIHYVKGDVDEANSFLKRCLVNDPENSQCKALFKKIKAVKKILAKIEAKRTENKHKDVVEQSKLLMKDATDSEYFVAKAQSYICVSEFKQHNYETALPFCTSAIKILPSEKDARYARADIYIQKELFDEAREEFNQILKLHPNDQTATDGLRKIEKLLKNKNRRDYYKILNVSKTATRQEIEKAYRKLVKIHHPDHHREEDEKKEANKKLQDLNDARLVLVDEEKRRKFDSGIDPLDPEQNSGGQDFGGHQHQQFHFHQGGGGGSFFNFFRGGNFFGENGGGPF